MKRVLTFLFASMLVLCASASAQAPRRVALIVANGAYQYANRLSTPAGDAQIVAAAARRAGFQEVTVQSDLAIGPFRQALRTFQSRAAGAQVAMIYYAGHGLEAAGANWLVPTDARLESDQDLEFEAVRLDLVMQTVSRADLRIVVLDACRDNPLSRNMRRLSPQSRAVTRGLGEIQADNVLVMYAAAAGTTASDGVGNSPFARAFAQRLPEAGVEITLMARRVRDDVVRATSAGGRPQTPFISASLPGEEFYLVPGARAPAPQDQKLQSDLELALKRITELEERERRRAASLPATTSAPASQVRPQTAPPQVATPSTAALASAVRARAGAWKTDPTLMADYRAARGYFVLLKDTYFIQAGAILTPPRTTAQGARDDGQTRFDVAYAYALTDIDRWWREQVGNPTYYNFSTDAADVAYLGPTWSPAWTQLTAEIRNSSPRGGGNANTANVYLCTRTTTSCQRAR